MWIELGSGSAQPAVVGRAAVGATMPVRTRIYVAFFAVAVAGLGNVIAQTTLQTKAHERAPRIQRPAPVVNPRPVPQFGDPLYGLSAAKLAAFSEGLGDFQDEDIAASGLGPVFNNVSCVACHSVPAIGGGSTILETRFGRVANGQFDPLTELGGSLLQQSAIDPTAQEVIPQQANIVAKRMTTPLFGAGLIEAIPDVAILLNALAPKPDGISGRVSIVHDVASGQIRKIGRASCR